MALHFFSNIFFEPKIFLQTENFLGPKIFRQKILSLPKRFLNQKFFGPKILFQNLFQTQNVWNPNFVLKIVLDAKFMKPFQAEHFRLSLVSQKAVQASPIESGQGDLLSYFVCLIIFKDFLL